MIELDSDSRPIAVQVVIPDDPYPQKRHRYRVAYRYNRKTGRKEPFVASYDPPENESFKRFARIHMRAALRPARLELPVWPEGPLMLRFVAGFKLASSLERKRQPVEASWKVAKPDIDNLAKAIMDAATGVFWKDDCQVCLVAEGKKTLAQGEEPGTWVSVTRLADRGVVGNAVEAELTRFGLRTW